MADEVVVDAAGVSGQVRGVEPDRFGHCREFAAGDEAVERLFAAVIGVDAFLAGPRGLGDALDPGTGDAVLGELGGRRSDDAVAGRLGVAAGGHAIQPT